MKIVELVIKNMIESSLNINKMQYGFMTVHGTMDTILFFWQMHKNIAENISHSILLL